MFKNVPRLLQILALATVTFTLTGCGPDGPARYDLSGTVTFDGKPVPYGNLLFSPDSSQGNQGPGSMATIKDGKYKTFSGKGTCGGPHRVTITGYPRRPDDGVQPLFSTYQTTTDLPKENGTYDFTVPK